MKVRPIEPRDQAAWAAMRWALWPDEDRNELEQETKAHFTEGAVTADVLVCEDGGRLIGMIELGIRSYAEGAEDAPCPHIEAWYVAADARRRGVGRALVQAAEDWAREHGFRELTSDVLLDNDASLAAHGALGFGEVERIVCFHKKLGV